MNFFGISLRNGYLQTWGLASRINRRAKWLGSALRWTCGKLTGHRASKTEWGYGGGGMVDVWCRWCNQPGQIPMVDADKRFADMRGMVWSATGCDIRQGEWTPPPNPPSPAVPQTTETRRSRDPGRSQEARPDDSRGRGR